MLPVEILADHETIVLRARGSELLILPHHVHQLKALTKPVDFSAYFRSEALVNRPARKLFEAWLRKDTSVWTRLYRTVHHEMDLAAKDGDGADTKSAPAVKAPGKPAAEVKTAKDELKASATKAKPTKTQAVADEADAVAPKAAKAPAKAKESKGKVDSEDVAPSKAKAKTSAAKEATAKPKAKEAVAKPKGKEPAAKAKAKETAPKAKAKSKG
ncbi:MAG: hypothetical protein NTZ90_07020 [Proteobacteria bacterium]|nr:hypothetical protein [Pseudomonadota bacterium]